MDPSQLPTHDDRRRSQSPSPPSPEKHTHGSCGSGEAGHSSSQPSAGSLGPTSLVYVDEPSGDEACQKCAVLKERVNKLKADVESLQQLLQVSLQNLRMSEETLKIVIEQSNRLNN